MRAVLPTLLRAPEHPPIWRAVSHVRAALGEPLVLAALGLTLALAALTATVALHPHLSFVAVDPRLDTVVNTLATAVTALVAAASWLRFRETNRGATLLQAVAFMVLTISGTFTLVGSLSPYAATLGMSLDAPGQIPAYRAVIVRIVVASLFVAAAVALVRGWIPARRTGRALAGGVALAVPVVFTLLFAARDVLPVLIEPAAVQALRTATVAGLFSGTGLPVAAAALFATTAFGAAAVLYLRCARRTGDPGLGFLGLGLIVAAAANAHFGLFPGVHADLVATEDLLRVAFAVVLLLALVADQQGDLRALRTAKVALARYRDADVQRARAEERARLARDLHDGLAQQLWRARLAHGRMLANAPLDERARALAAETERALHDAILEARLALDATRRAGGERSVAATIDGELHDFRRRTGIRTEITGRGRIADVPEELGTELHGILREALSNVERHADATLVRASLELANGTLAMEVADNGRGFEPGRRREHRYGLLGMQERAAILGGRLDIRSAPSAGTRVRVVVPLVAAARGAA